MIILNKVDDLHYANGCFIDEGTYNEIAELQKENEQLNDTLKKILSGKPYKIVHTNYKENDGI